MQTHSTEDNIVLQEIKKYPLLYNKECAEFHDKHLSKKAWEKITEAVYKDEWEKLTLRQKCVKGKYTHLYIVCFLNTNSYKLHSKYLEMKCISFFSYLRYTITVQSTEAR